MIFRIFKIYQTGKTLYTKILKPIYEELRKDAYATDDKRTNNRKRKKKNADDKKSDSSRRRKKNIE